MSTRAASSREAFCFALVPDAPRFAQSATFGCEAERGAPSRLGRQFNLLLGDPERVFLLRHSGRGLRRIARCRHPLNIHSDTIGRLCELSRKSRAKCREVRTGLLQGGSCAREVGTVLQRGSTKLPCWPQSAPPPQL